jgi:hypothetical protein
MTAESISVEYDPSFSPPSRAGRARLCKTCGGELEDRRMTYHPECKPEPSTATASNATLKGVRGGRKRTTKVTDATHKGMTSITGKLLYLLTLYIAWSQLRGIGIPDPSGDIADSLAMTDEEAEVVGKPLARLFLQTEQGRRLAPKLVEHEDSIDAIFAIWNWYQRSTKTLDEYRAASGQVQAPMPAPAPRTRQPRRRPGATLERSGSNAVTGQVEEDRTTVEGDGEAFGHVYIPPAPQDLIGI